MFQACVCAHFLFNSTNTPPDGANRGSGLRSSCLERRSWPITPPLACRHSMVKWSGISSFLKAKRSLPAVRVPGVSQEAALASAFSTPRRLHTFTRFASSCTSSRHVFPSFLTMPYLTYIDVTAACISELSGTSVVPCSHMFSCLFF